MMNMTVFDNHDVEISNVTTPANDTRWTRAAYIGSGVYLTIVGVTAIFGNCVVLMVLIRDPRLRSKPHNLLLVNLASADLLCLLGAYWLTAVSGYTNHWMFGEEGCVATAFWAFFTSLTSMNTLVAVCVYRYIMICLPGKSFVLTRYLTAYVIGFTWAYSAFWTGIPLLGWGGYAAEPFGTSCSLDWADHSYSSTTYMVSCIIFCYVVHLSIMIRCYRSISTTVKEIASRDRNRGRIVVSMEDVIHSASVTDDQQVTRMCFLVVIVFMCVWTPYALVCFIHIFYSEMPLALTALPTMCAKTGCMINPMIYFVTNKSFRAKAFDLLCCTRQINAVGVDIPAHRDNTASKENFDKVTKEGIYLGSETVTVEHGVTMF